MNREAQYSLLNCPGKYSVKVATFSGSTLIDQKKIKAVKNGSRLESKLAEAGDKAALLAEQLRKEGVEAYEFHDEHESIVCVGSFDYVAGEKDPETGKQQINPAVYQVMEKFKAKPGVNGTGMHPSKSYEFPVGKDNDGKIIKMKASCDLQPIPVQVPKQTVSGVYQR